jgi:hypothetical protein
MFSIFVLIAFNPYRVPMQLTPTTHAFRYHALPTALPAPAPATDLDEADPAWAAAFGPDFMPEVDARMTRNPDYALGTPSVQLSATVGKVGFDQALASASFASAHNYDTGTLTALMQGRDGAYYLGGLIALPQSDGDVDYMGVTKDDVTSIRSADPAILALVGPDGWVDLRP